MTHRSMRRFRRRLAGIAVLTTATCFAFGTGCIQAVLAAFGATFF